MLIFIQLAGRDEYKVPIYFIEIWLLSRGPDDNGLVVDGPGRLAKKAFENGALNVNWNIEEFSAFFFLMIEIES